MPNNYDTGFEVLSKSPHKPVHCNDSPDEITNNDFNNNRGHILYKFDNKNNIMSYYDNEINKQIVCKGNYWDPTNRSSSGYEQVGEEGGSSIRRRTSKKKKRRTTRHKKKHSKKKKRMTKRRR